MALLRRTYYFRASKKSVTFPHSPSPLMKNTLRKVAVLALGLALVGSAAAQAQTSERAQRNWVVRANLFGLLLQPDLFAIERRIAPNFSLGLQTGFTSRPGSNDIEYDYFSIGPELRFYPFGKAPKGLFLGANLSYERFAAKRIIDVPPGLPFATVAREEAELNGVGYGLKLGYQFLIANRVALGLHAGYRGIDGPTSNYKAFDQFGNVYTSTDSEFISRGWLQIGLTLGVAF
jgi:hypothetical protein